MYNKLVSCIDINSPYCPCLLAETNHCVFCSQLQGKTSCDCNWAGVCILYEKHWHVTKNEEQCEDLPIRIEVETELVIKEKLNDNAYLLELEVTQDLAESLNKPGAFVFMRRVCDAHFYHFPVGIMKVAENKIQVVIESLGPKSTRIFAEGGKKILIRGPYFNGIFGQPWIDKLICGKIILLAGGMGQAPALPIIKALVKNDNDITAILAPGRIGKVFLDDELDPIKVKIHNVSSMRREGLSLLNKMFSDTKEVPDLVVSAGPDEQHYGIIAAMQAAGVNIPMAATNNATMCCGEGICGSCDKETVNHQIVRACKAQTDFMNFIRYK